MRESKRKKRLFALSSLDNLQAGPPDQTLRMRHNGSLCTLDGFETWLVVGACLPAQMAIATAQNG